MKCKKIQSIVIKGGFQNLSAEDDLIFAKHVENCQECLKFQQDFRLMQQSVTILKKPFLSPVIDCETKKRCINELLSEEYFLKNHPVTIKNVKIPKIILAALLILTLLTMVLIASGSVEYFILDSISPGTFFTLILIIQNALMLILSPLLIFKYGKKRRIPLLVIKNG